MSDPYPSIEESATAVAKVVATRRARYRANPDHGALTPSAIAERVTGVTVPPRAGRDGWWLVGRVLDELEETEFSVWYIPGARRIGLSRRNRPVVIAPPPSGSAYYYDGLRHKWIDAITGEVVADPNAVAPGAREHESGPRAAT
jgi:hypothetical protein